MYVCVRWVIGLIHHGEPIELFLLSVVVSAILSVGLCI